MQLSRSFSLSIGLLALPLAVACGDDAGNGTTPTTSTTTVTPPPPPPSNPPVTPSTPPVTPSTPVTPTTPPVTPTTPPVNPPPPATDTWTTVYPILQAKCDNASCHGASEFQPTLIGEEATIKANATAAADKIAMRTASDALLPMPPASSTITLTDAERAAIQAWATGL